ncbi:gliding motility lipoprotein GldH [Labilibaculum sp. K2S]|uniref:gliding motility lipoprotein GldH n=1 Tax=Labilibaculum sp. K2S TaxID=3056386 RepID=UPI0025A3B46A|nr:gliding motility lipoprotein GldH [Labilibaculum sp. K2S]MDM8161240.1 gliding motility lipoprotein GldH [Labilibaculum sp. K2S]
MKMLRILCTLLLGVVVLSCDSNRVYEQYENIPDFEWNQENVLRFEVEITDTIHANNIFINLRNSGDYAYSNLWVFVKVISPDNELDEEKVEIELADETGDWYGSGFGDIFDLQVSFKQKVVFPKSGKYVFEITQGMYDRKLKGIVNVGIRIEKENR